MRVLTIDGEQVKMDTSNTYETTGVKAIRLVCLTGEPFGMATVNVEDVYLMDGEVILDTNNIPSIFSILMSEGVVEDTGRVASSGFCQYPIVKLLEESYND